MSGADQRQRYFRGRLRVGQHLELELNLKQEFSFDRQARFFDRRAGLPAAASREVAAVVVSRLAPATGDLLLDLGAGTGEVGEALWRLLPAGTSYLALDLSLAMLHLFGKKALRDKLSASGSPARLDRVLADGARRWPVAAGAASAIFSSRAAHRLGSPVFLAETRRVLRPGGQVIFGSLARARGSVRAQLQRRMREILAEVLGAAEGRPEPGGEAEIRDSRRHHLGLATSLGGRFEAFVATRFEVLERPADSLAGWRSKRGLAGLELSVDQQEEVLGRLESWARGQYGDLNTPRPAIESYELLIVRPGTAEEKV